MPLMGYAFTASRFFLQVREKHSGRGIQLLTSEQKERRRPECKSSEAPGGCHSTGSGSLTAHRNCVGRFIVP